MGWDDQFDDERSNLPPEAFNPFDDEGPFDPQNHWLETADDDDALTAMRAWFADRYCDPAYDTPYSSSEGGYIFIHGGPYDPADVLYQRFSGIVDDDLIQRLVDELYAEVGDMWAPVQDEYYRDYEYDDRLELIIAGPDDPFRLLQERLNSAQSVLALQGNEFAEVFAKNLVFGAVISALEAFLYETVGYWADSNEEVVRRLVTRLPALSDRSLTLKDIFVRHADLKNEVKGYLQAVVWHRWEKVAPLFRMGFEFEPPGFDAFSDAILKRHHIVHRSGHDHEGTPIVVSDDEIAGLCDQVGKFAEEIKNKIAEKFPAQGAQMGASDLF